MLAASVLGLGVFGVLLAVVVIAADASAASGSAFNQPPIVRAEAADAALSANPLYAEYTIVAIDAHANLVPMTGLAKDGGRTAVRQSAGCGQEGGRA